MVPSFKDSKDLCDRTNALWQEYFKQHFDSLLIDVTSMEHDIEYQKRKEGDFIVKLDIPEHIGNTQTIETKIRHGKYYEIFLKDRCVLFEMCGNIEASKTGSSFLDCKADLYAYGFSVDGIDAIHHPLIFYVKPLQEFLNNNRRNYRVITSNTEGLYTTSFILVPLKDIPDDCIFRSLHIPKIRKLDELFWSDK